MLVVEPSFERCGATLGISPQPILGKQFARGVFGACGGNIHPRGVMARKIHIQRQEVALIDVVGEVQSPHVVAIATFIALHCILAGKTDTRITISKD